MQVLFSRPEFSHSLDPKRTVATLLVSRYLQEELADLEKINPLWTY
jgi:hypothetical protein